MFRGGTKMIEIIDDEQDQKRKELVMKQIRIARWEQSKIVPRIKYLLEETRHEMIVS